MWGRGGSIGGGGGGGETGLSAENVSVRPWGGGRDEGGREEGWRFEETNCGAE